MTLRVKEVRYVKDPMAITRQLAYHMYTTTRVGQVVIVIDRPRIMLSVLRKQWASVTRSVHRCRASTLNQRKICMLSKEALRLHDLRFCCDINPALIIPDVVLISPENIKIIPATCRTLYIVNNTITAFNVGAKFDCSSLML